MGDFSFDVFVSYAHADIEFARCLVNWIRLSGFSVWFDEEQLVPGSRFRAGLQQGLRDSKHLVALLTNSYSTRPWTQREVDLFDLTAEHTHRRLLAVKFGDVDQGPLDQVFLVHQIIDWQGRIFDGQSFWRLYCGLTSQRPGPRAEWSKNGRRLVKKQRRVADIGCSDEDIRIWSRQYYLQGIKGTHPRLLDLASQCLLYNHHDWQLPFSQLKTKLREVDSDTVRQLLVQPWALGNTELSAVVSLALIPQWYGPDAVWPFVDLGCENIARWFLSTLYLTHSQAASEIWFSWVISEEAWPLLPLAASRVPVESARKHFEQVSAAALRSDVSFKQTEQDYDYGVMITPWNHLHLCWLALKLRDLDSSIAHAEALCESALRGELRAGRYLARLSNWSCFEPIRTSRRLEGKIEIARATLGLEKMSMSRKWKQRIEKIWLLVMKRMAEAS